jgi:NDP-sugar pyrophosphorylase family protein
MSTYKVQQIPVVDHTHRLTDLHLYEDFTVENKRINTVVIMAGGRGSRLYPKTENCPKPLLQISGKPILEHVINRAKTQGFSRFVISIHYLGEMIEEYFGDGKSFGVTIEYLREEAPLGTAGGLGSLTTSPDIPFIVTNGDVITDISYGELIDFHLQQNSMATMAVRKFDLVNPFGVVKLSGNRIVGFEEKPIISSMINAGVYALNPEALNYLTKGAHSNMPELFQQLREAGHQISAYPIFEGWMDLGTPQDLLAAESSDLIQSKETDGED